MIAGIFHSGSGLGNQLHRYVATRVLALDKGYDFSMVAPENFKGKSFVKLDMGLPNDISCITTMPAGKVEPTRRDAKGELERIPIWEEKTNYYNPEFNFIGDSTIIDGEFQDERYFGHRLKEVDEWLAVKEWNIPDNVCVVGFRGGEYYQYPELGLPPNYFYDAMELMINVNPKMKFEIHTDDKVLAQQFFPVDNVIQNMELNWRSMRYAKYAIIPNSSFYILPRLLNEGMTIAPRWWARRNAKEWSMPQNYYKSFLYI